MNQNNEYFPESWNEAIVEWHKYAKHTIEETFTQETIKYAERLFKLKDMQRDSFDTKLASEIDRHEKAIRRYFSYKDQFNLNHYGKDLFECLKDKSKFNDVVAGLNYILFGEIPFFRSKYSDDQRPNEIIAKDMVTLKAADEVIMRLGFDQLEATVEYNKGNNVPTLTRSFLRDLYSDLEKVLEITKSKKYKPEVLSDIQTKILNTQYATQYFQQDDKAYIGSITRRLMEAFDTAQCEVNKTLAKKTIREIATEVIYKKNESTAKS